METAIITSNEHGIQHHQQTWSREQIDLIKRTVAKDATDTELQMFQQLCARYNLDPFARQIHFVKRKGVATIQTDIDGYRLIAERTGNYMPGRKPEFHYDAHGNLVSATTFVQRYHVATRTWHEISAEAFYNEYCVWYDGKPSGMWARMPHVMLAKCSETQALRRAFPAELSGLYSSEEMLQQAHEQTPEAFHPPTLSAKQRRMLFEIARKNNWTDEMIREALHAEFGLASTAGILAEHFDAFVEYFEKPSNRIKYEVEETHPNLDGIDDNPPEDGELPF